MDKTQIVSLLVGSAVIGVLVSAGITALSQWRERIARQNELILSKSVELAMKHTEVRMKMAEGMQTSVDVIPEIVIARFFPRQLTRLFTKHRISTDMEKEFYEAIHRQSNEGIDTHAPSRPQQASWARVGTMMVVRDKNEEKAGPPAPPTAS
jgi:hypothetical protein